VYHCSSKMSTTPNGAKISSHQKIQGHNSPSYTYSHSIA